MNLTLNEYGKETLALAIRSMCTRDMPGLRCVPQYAVVLFCMTVAGMEATAGAQTPKASASGGIVYIGETEVQGLSNVDALREQIGDRVADGIRATGRLVVSLYDLKRGGNGVLPAMKYLNTWMKVPIEREF